MPLVKPTQRKGPLLTNALFWLPFAGEACCSASKTISSRLCGQVALDQPDQHRRLAVILDGRLQMLSENYAPPTDVYDPMLLFAHIMSQATILYISQNTLREVARPQDSSQNETKAKTQQRALAAADKIIALTRCLADFHVFKVRRSSMHQPAYMDR